MNRTLALLILFSTLAFSFGQESMMIPTEEGSIHYKVFGSGTPILIVNGGPGFSSEGFEHIGKEIASLGYQTILYDQRGTGKSTLNRIDETTITLDLMITDIEVIRKNLGIDHWIVFGHSFGGMLANYYASKFPDKIMAMIHSSSGGMDLRLTENARANLYARLTEQEIDSLEYWRSKFRENESDHNRSKYYTYLAAAYVFHEAHIPTVSQRLMQGDMRLNRLVWNHMFDINFDCKGELQSFNKPVLILQGKQDIIPQSLALTAASIFSNSSLYFLEDCGHYGWLDQKDEYLRRIKDFLNDIEKVKTIEKNK